MKNNPPNNKELSSYAIAGLTVALTWLLMLLLNQSIEITVNPFLLFFVAIIISSFSGSFGSGIFATTLSALVIAYWYLPPVNSFDMSWEAAPQFSLFLLEGVFLNWLIAQVQAARQVNELTSASSTPNYNLLQRVTEETTDAIFAKDIQGRYLMINSAGASYIGKSVEEIIGKQDRELFTQETVSKILEDDQSIYTNQHSKTYEESIITNNLTYTYLTTKAPFYDAQGNISGLIGIAKNISLTKQLEQELRVRCRQQEVIAKLGQLALSGVELDTLLNETATVISQTLEVEYCKVLELLPEGNAFQLRAGIGWQSGLVGQVTVGTELASQAGYTLLSQHPVIVEDLRTETRFQGPPLLQSHGVVSGMSVIITGQQQPWGVLGAHTTQKRQFTQDDINFFQAVANLLAEAIARKQVEAALQQSEARSRRLIDSNIIGVIFSDLNGGLTDANDAFLEMVGYTREDLRSGKVSWIDITPPEYLPLDEIGVEQAKTFGSCTPYEKEYIRADGSRVPVALAYSLLSPDSDEAIGFVLDISEQQAALRESKRAKEDKAELLASEQAARTAAEAANRMKDEFLAIVSHELRSPLNAILGWAQMLRSRNLPEGMLTKALETIERNAWLQAQLIEDLLDVSRIIRGKLRLNLYPIKLNSLIEAALNTARPAAEAKEIRLLSMLDATVGQVLGDSERLQQVVWNLLSNAIKFTPEGGQVSVMLQSVNSQVEIRVSDTGIGIKPEFLPFVFERFRQADGTSTRAYSGLGLGLAIVRHLVELHGGSVQVESLGEDMGTTFTVKLPLCKQEGGTTLDDGSNSLNDGSEMAIYASSLTSHDSLQGLQVLVLDDEEDAREFFATALQEWGAQVKATASAREALEIIPRWKPDVLISDIGMPEEDGYSFIRKVRSLPLEQGGQIPAVALTAYARHEDRQRALSEGFQKHLSKPVEPAKLAAVVAKLAQVNQEL